MAETVNMTGHTTPAIDDGHGFVVTTDDLQFLELTRESITHMYAHTVPLGLDEEMYGFMLDELVAALTADQVDLRSVDVRLKGSAANFFSGAHKPMPHGPDEVSDLFRVCRERFPKPIEIRRICHTMDEVWLGGRRPPSRRPFDSIFKLGIDRVESDYDLQLSSTAMVRRCEVRAGTTYSEITDKTTHHDVYGFVRKDLVREEFHNLRLFETVISDVLMRSVSIALFDDNGPEDRSETEPELSAHFSTEDWQIKLASDAN